jgi:hypothetical protein
MDQQQHHQQQNQQIPPGSMNGNAPSSLAPATISHNGGNNSSSNNHINPHVPLHMGSGGPGMNAHIMGQLMTNPAFAAAAAASPLFPPAAIMTNPGAFLTMPEYYTSAIAIRNDQNAKDSAALISSAATLPPQQIRASQTSQSGFPLSNNNHPVQRQQGGQIFPLPIAFGPNMNVNPLAPSSVHAHMAASAAASQAIANNDPMEHDEDESTTGKGGKRKKDMTPAERAKLNKERNREHAKSTRLRKKAYLHKLKDLVEGLHAERTKEVRQRRVAIQHLAETQNVRRAVIRSFLRYHSNYEPDKRKWETLLEDNFWLKQPVTPYRCFRRSEIEQVRPCSDYERHFCAAESDSRR